MFNIVLRDPNKSSSSPFNITLTEVATTTTMFISWIWDDDM